MAHRPGARRRPHRHADLDAALVPSPPGHAPDGLYRSGHDAPHRASTRRDLTTVPTTGPHEAHTLAAVDPAGGETTAQPGIHCQFLRSLPDPSTALPAAPETGKCGPRPGPDRHHGAAGQAP